jgi:hypothetical protein
VTVAASSEEPFLLGSVVIAAEEPFLLGAHSIGDVESFMIEAPAVSVSFVEPFSILGFARLVSAEPFDLGETLQVRSSEPFSILGPGDAYLGLGSPASPKMGWRDRAS